MRVSSKSRHVQMMDILYRGRITTVNFPRPWDFVSVHKQFTHPSSLLNPKISLYSANQTHAFFIEVPEEVDIYSSKTSPFMYMAQHKHAIKIYSMPLRHFHKLTQEIGDPTVPVVYISSTGRCGSTLLIQMLETLPKTLCLSEPDTLTNICLMDRARQLPPEEIQRLLQSTIRFVCKESNEYQRIVIKTRFNCSTELPYICKIFPDFKHLYLYRNMGQVLKSYYKFLHRDPAVLVSEMLFNSYFLSTFFPILRKQAYHLVAGEKNREKLKAVVEHISSSGFAACVIGSCVVEFQNFVNKSGIKIPTLHYDELMRCPVEVTTKMFEVLDLPIHYVQVSLSAMQHDTQKGTILSNMASSYNKKMPGADIKASNLALSLLGLPDMNQTLVLAHPVENGL